ncbi:hypothetical protein GQ53DRAFT_745409 [Thozetella sp. PMI_491]|nr:hypothetical protein GQ53DRAFT_745409 [Thozetella sp. PMI_491]
MQAPGFVCRSCLARIQRQCRVPRQVRLARRLNLSTATERQPLTKRSGELEGVLPSESTTRSVGKVYQNEAPRAYEKVKGGSSKVSQPTTVAAAEARNPERTFDTANYPAEDQRFWEKYDELWTSSFLPEESVPEDAVPLLGYSGQDPVSTTTRHARASKPESKRWWGQRPQDRKRELYLVLRDVPDKKRASKRYNVWKKQFSYIWRAVQDEKPLPSTGMPSELKWLLRFDSVEAMKEAWHLQPPEKRDVKWIHVMLGALRFTPHKAHLVLEAILEPKDLQVGPFYAISDTLRLLAQRSGLELPGENKEELANSLADSLILVLQTLPPETFLLRQNDLYRIITKATGKRLADLYSALRAYNHPLHTNTLLQFARFLAMDVDHKPTALGIMQELAESDAIDINSPRGAALCTSIMSVSEEDATKELRATPAQLFEVLLELGLKPNIITYTTIIRNLCLNKELKVAWEVFDIMQQHRIEPDLHVYSILLNGAKLCEDFESINRVLQLAESQGVGAPILWNDVIHVILLLYMKEARSQGLQRPWVLPAFQAMFRTYANVYRTTPLQTFALSDLTPLLRQSKVTNETADGEGARNWQATNAKALSLTSRLHPWKPEERLEPGSDTLGLMLIGYISGFSQVYNIIAFYSRFRSMLKSGNPVAVRFVQEKGTLLHDIVIKAVVEWPGMLRVALDVVSDMLKDGIASASALHTATSPDGEDTARHPAPSIYTWNILLNGFMRHQHLRQGERILAMMREHGLEPDIASWNTLLAGYARTQKVSKTVDALQRLERAGFRPDEYTMRGFSYLNNQKAAVDMMEGIMERRRQNELTTPSEKLGSNTPEESLGVEAALRDMEMVVDEVAALTSGPTIHEVGAEDYEWDGPEESKQHSD